MRVALDHQLHVIRLKPEKGKLRGRKVFFCDRQNLAKTAKIVFLRCRFRIRRVFRREAGINEHSLTRRGLDNVPRDANDPVVFMHLKQAEIENGKTRGGTFEEGLHLPVGTFLLEPELERVGRMKVKIHRLFQYLLESTAKQPEAIVGFSLSAAPTLGDFLDDLDPALPLDWNNRDFRGLPELRAHVLAQAALSETCNLDDVLITAGAAEANYLAIMQLLQPGDEIVVETPGWPQAEVLARAKGNRVVKVRRREQDNWALPLDDLKSAVGPKTKLIFLSNPNNPTGQVLGRQDLEQVIDIADAVGAWLLVDEVYAGLEWRGPRAPSIAGIYPRGITTGSVSKALGLQGLRTGWLISQDSELVMDAVILRENSSEIMNIMGEVISEIALRPDRLASSLEAARQAGRKNLKRLENWLGQEPCLNWVPPQAGLIGLGRLPDHIDSDDFARRLMEEPYRTFLLPGSVYGQPNHVRLGVGGGAEVNLELGLERVSRALQNWPD